jgi:hypothetical protein
MQYETAVRCGSRYSWMMQIEYMRAMLTGAWMLFIAALGYATGITSFVGLTALLAVALTPAVVTTRFWGAPARTISETIQDVLRVI